MTNPINATEESIAANMPFIDAVDYIDTTTFIPLSGAWVIRLTRLDSNSFDVALFKRMDPTKPGWRINNVTGAEVQFYQTADEESDNNLELVTSAAVAIDPIDTRVLGRLTFSTHSEQWIMTTLRHTPSVDWIELATMIPSCTPMSKFLEFTKGQKSFSIKEALAIVHVMDLYASNKHSVGPTQRAIRMRVG